MDIEYLKSFLTISNRYVNVFFKEKNNVVIKFLKQNLKLVDTL